MSQPVNPYAPPQALEGPQQVSRAPGVVYRPYQSTAAKTKAVMITSAILILLHVVLVVSFGMQLSMLYAAAGGPGLDQAAADSNDLRQQAITILVVLAVLAALIALLVWVYGTHANLPALGASELAFTPGWAVGWFFIPIANLFKPFQAVREIWFGSQPQPILGHPQVGVQLVGWWWGLRIVSAISERILSSVSNTADTIDSLIAVSWAAIIITLVIDAPMTICQLLMARRIEQFQNQRHELILAQLPSILPRGENPFAFPPA